MQEQARPGKGVNKIIKQNIIYLFIYKNNQEQHQTEMNSPGKNRITTKQIFSF